MKFSTKIAAVACTGLIALATVPAAAQTVVYQSTPSLTANPLTNGYCSACSFAQGQYIGGAFTLGSAATVGGVNFAVNNSYNFPTSITVSVFRDGGTTVGSQLFSQTYSSFNSNTPTAFGTSVLNVSLGAVSLSAGNYLIFFTNPTDLAIPDFGVGDGNLIFTQGVAGQTPTAGDNYGRLGGSSSVGYQLLSASVPEPATWAMMVMGFGLAGAGLRRRQRVTARVAFA